VDNSKSSTRAEYLKHIEQQKESGLSIKKYCEQNNLVDHKFSYYQTYKLRGSRKKKSVFSKVKLDPLPVPSNFQSVDNFKKTTVVDPLWLAQFAKELMSLK
jgi:UDP-N-acetylglucosamine pyrophosphorylase